MGMCTGNIIGPLLYSTDAPLYRPGLIANLAMFVIVGILGLYVLLDSYHPPPNSPPLPSWRLIYTEPQANLV